jgi:hypothetical protein
MEHLPHCNHLVLTVLFLPAVVLAEIQQAVAVVVVVASVLELL